MCQLSKTFRDKLRLLASSERPSFSLAHFGRDDSCREKKDLLLFPIDVTLLGAKLSMLQARDVSDLVEQSCDVRTLPLVEYLHRRPAEGILVR